MWIVALLACEGTEPNYDEDFAYSRECNELCEPSEAEHWAEQCADDPTAITTECAQACEDVLTDRPLDCAACILDWSDGWGFFMPEVTDNSSAEGHCDDEWELASPTDCTEACGE